MHIREQLRPYVMEQYQAAADFGTPVRLHNFVTSLLTLTAPSLSKT
jgi:hypothetical protein